MTTETTEVTKIVNLIKLLHEARRKKNEGEREDNLIAPVVKAHLKTLPEGEQELWDREVDPPLGVALESGGGHRWVDTTQLTDEQIVFLVRKGILGGFVAKVYDAIKDVPDQEALGYMIALARAIKEGGAEKLVMLPKRRGG